MPAPKIKLISALYLTLSVVITITIITVFLSNRRAQADLSKESAMITAEETAAASTLIDQTENVNIAQANFGKIPLTFEENRGQTNASVKFVSRSMGGTILLSATETKVALPQKRAAGKTAVKNTAESKQNNWWQMNLLGANAQAIARGIEPLAGKSNYFVGSDSANWRMNVSNFARAEFGEIYPGIDIVYYGNQEKLEYDFIVKPTAKPEQISLGFDGAEKVSLAASGDLLIQTRAGAIVTQKKPFAYQEANGVRQEIACQFKISEGERGKRPIINFEVGDYDKNQKLIIDPVLIYSTYLGGSGGDLFNAEQGNRIMADAAGNAYVVGITPSADFPTLNPLQAATGGGSDCFVAKLSANGSNLVFSTFLGGSQNDVCTGLDLDAAGNIYLAGQTFSDNFPIVNPFQAINKGNGDVFIAKLNQPVAR